MKKNSKMRYVFWQWLILQIVRVQKLYVLAWGVIIALLIACLKTDIAVILSGMMA